MCNTCVALHAVGHDVVFLPFGCVCLFFVRLDRPFTLKARHGFRGRRLNCLLPSYQLWTKLTTCTGFPSPPLVLLLANKMLGRAQGARTKAASLHFKTSRYLVPVGLAVYVRSYAKQAYAACSSLPFSIVWAKHRYRHHLHSRDIDIRLAWRAQYSTVSYKLHDAEGVSLGIVRMRRWPDRPR